LYKIDCCTVHNGGFGLTFRFQVQFLLSVPRYWDRFSDEPRSGTGCSCLFSARCLFRLVQTSYSRQVTWMRFPVFTLSLGLYKLLHFSALQLQPWRWRQYVSPKRRYISTYLQGVTPQKNIVFWKANRTQTFWIDWWAMWRFVAVKSPAELWGCESCSVFRTCAGRPPPSDWLSRLFQFVDKWFGETDQCLCQRTSPPGAHVRCNERVLIWAFNYMIHNAFTLDYSCTNNIIEQQSAFQYLFSTELSQFRRVWSGHRPMDFHKKLFVPCGI
jgi:hypothetical protein